MVNQSNNLQHLITGGGTRNALSFTAFFPPIFVWRLQNRQVKKWEEGDGGELLQAISKGEAGIVVRSRVSTVSRR